MQSDMQGNGSHVKSSVHQLRISAVRNDMELQIKYLQRDVHIIEFWGPRQTMKGVGSIYVIPIRVLLRDGNWQIIEMK